jgi:hypothetical protein
MAAIRAFRLSTFHNNIEDFLSGQTAGDERSIRQHGAQGVQMSAGLSVLQEAEMLDYCQLFAGGQARNAASWLMHSTG